MTLCGRAPDLLVEQEELKSGPGRKQDREDMPFSNVLPSPRLLIISPARPPPKQEDYQTDVFSHCLGHPEARERILAVKGKGKSDVPTLGRPSEDSVLNKYLLNESVHVCQELGTKIKVPWPLDICSQVNRP